jgi:hypothetical protein
MKTKTTPTKKGSKPFQKQKTIKKKVKPSKMLTKVAKSGKVGTSNTITDIMSTGLDVLDTTYGSITGNPVAIAKIPQTIMKVIDTGSNVVKDLSNIVDKEKIVVDKNVQIKDENRKLVNELSKQMPVLETTQQPSAYSTTYTNPPIRLHENVTKNGVKVTNVQGSAMYTSGFNYPGSTAFTVAGVVRLSPTASSSIFGARVQTMAALYQRWRLNSFSLHYVPTQPTSQPGNIYLVAHNGTDDSLIGSQTAQQISQYEHYVSIHGCQKGSIAVRAINPWLWTTQTTGTDPLKFYYNWILAWFTSGNSSTVAGQIIFNFDLDFAQPVPVATSFYSTFRNLMASTWITCTPVNVSYVSFIKAIKSAVKFLRDVARSKDLEDDPLTFADEKSFKQVTKMLNDRVKLVIDTTDEKTSMTVEAVFKYILKQFYDMYKDLLDGILDEHYTMEEMIQKLLQVIKCLLSRLRKDLDPWEELSD